eukprot:TRINITY_DN45348_c0_g1_i1.p1 TRINITY_DN45348_c0_g1~~TRINITY_DN45348_c0_g1_i1.p1  ORF type:complete len:558 (+),score=154.46 TRINITY_DN45348_c0_g1_i1:243-1916(+)
MKTMARKLSYKSKKRAPTVDLCDEKHRSSGDIPAIGGIHVEHEHLMAYPLLPACVLLFEPKDEDIWLTPKMRAIFCNQPLQQWEEDEVSKFRTLLLEHMKLSHQDELPRWIVPHLTRLLQQTKYKADAAVSLWEVMFQERVKQLPIYYYDIKPILDNGFVYWHGRDVRHRPLLTIRLGRAGPIISDAEAIKRLFVFTMEFALRHLLVPGRVETWAVIIDCEGIEKLPSIMKCKSFGQAIATTMGKVYSGRMVWTKIFNFPSSWSYRALRMCVEGIVSALGKSEKVSFVQDAKAELAGKVALGQLEQWAGGTAPDLPPEKCFPYRMFANEQGYGSPGAESVEHSFHDRTTVQFHEGFIWADCLNKQTNWRQTCGETMPLSTAAAKYLGVQPVTTEQAWKQKMEVQDPPSAEPVEEPNPEAEMDSITEAASTAAPPADTTTSAPTTPGGALKGMSTVAPETDETPKAEEIKPEPEAKPARDTSRTTASGAEAADAAAHAPAAATTVAIKPLSPDSKQKIGDSTFGALTGLQTEDKKICPEIENVEAAVVRRAGCFSCAC